MFMEIAGFRLALMICIILEGKVSLQLKWPFFPKISLNGNNLDRNINYMPERDLTVVGDFLRYAGMLFVPFCTIGVIHGLFQGFSFMALLVNPFIYSVGISLIVIVISYDINTLLGLVGLGKEPQLSLHLKYDKDIQEIGMLMSISNYDSALKKVDLLLRKEPSFAMAHNLRGEILLQGFQQNGRARNCFDRAIKLSNPEDEVHQLATSLKDSTYK